MSEDIDIAHSQGPPHFCFDVNDRTILLKQVPVFMTRHEIRSQIDAIPELRGHLEEISFSDPLKMHNFERFAWLTFDSDETALTAQQELDGISVRVPELFSAQQLKDYTIAPVKSSQPNKTPKVTPPLPEGYVKEFYGLCRRLLHEVFDVEQLIEFPFQRLENELKTDKQRLDFVLLYLRRVHGYCFLCGVNCKDERQLAGKCSVQHLRNSKIVPRKEFETSAEHTESRNFYLNAIRKANEVLDHGPQEMKDPQEDDLLVEKKDQYCKIKTREVAMKTGVAFCCKLCEKFFKEPSFVFKHIKNKHADVLNEKFNSEHFKTIARDNYL